MRLKRNASFSRTPLDAEGKIDFADKSVTENTRVLIRSTIENIVRSCIFCTGSERGYLPVRRCIRRTSSSIYPDTEQQTWYYFLSGFTAKLAGTERGITEPYSLHLSACSGQAP